MLWKGRNQEVYGMYDTHDVMYSDFHLTHILSGHYNSLYILQHCISLLPLFSQSLKGYQHDPPFSQTMVEQVDKEPPPLTCILSIPIHALQTTWKKPRKIGKLW
jgi:hypothetical protein